MTEIKDDLISREALIKAIEQGEGVSWDSHGKDDLCVRKKYIDNALTVEPRDNFDLGYVKGLEDAKPQGEREFIEILAQDVPDDLCTYPEYRGKPYYSIHYKENGEEFVGFGTYNPEVLSGYLKKYFMRGGAEWSFDNEHRADT